MKNQFGIHVMIKDDSEIETYKARTECLHSLIQLIITQII